MLMVEIGIKRKLLVRFMEIKEITDPNSIFKMAETLFKQFPVYMIIDNKPMQIKILAMKNLGVLIQSPDTNPNPTERFLILTNAGNLLRFNFKVSTKDPRGIEILNPVSLTIKPATRATNRYQATKAPIYITNVISQTMVPHDLSDDTLKVESYMKPYIQKLKSKFTDVEFFVHERMDTRARLLLETGKHIFVPDTKSPESVSDEFIPFSEHIHLMRQGKGLNKYMSEICVPLKYRGIVLYGYLQVLNLEKTDINDYKLVLLAAEKFCKDIEESDLFNESKLKSTILDINGSGFSFSHPQSKHFGKLFSIGGTILFDMYEEEKRLGTFRAVVRNIKPLEKLFRIGCQFFHIAEEHVIIDDLMKKFFPQSLEKEEPVPPPPSKDSQPKIKTDAVIAATKTKEADNADQPETEEEPEEGTDTET
jgi:hypothetical protein